MKKKNRIPSGKLIYETLKEDYPVTISQVRMYRTPIVRIYQWRNMGCNFIIEGRGIRITKPGTSFAATIDTTDFPVWVSDYIFKII